MKLSISQTLAAAIVGLPLFFSMPAPAEEIPAPPVVEATDEQALEAAIGKDIVVEGTVVSTGKGPKDGVRFLNFSDDIETGFIAAIFPVAYAVTAPLETYAGQSVKVRGRLGRYKKHTQIRIFTDGQLTILPAHAED
jgi:hypothetical protein